MSVQTEQVTSNRKDAQQRLRAIRNALGRADGLLVEAWRARDWKALNHATWAEYVAEELPDYQLIGVRAAIRDQRILELAREGMSQGAIADGFGIGRGTVNRALAGVELGETITATDGRKMAARAARSPAPKRKGPRKTDRTVELLITAGPDGLDVREVAKALRCERHEASATLTRLVAAGRIAYREPERRGLFGRYGVTGTVPTGTVER